MSSVVALLGLFACYRLTVDTAKGGLSRAMQTASIVQYSVDPATQAVRLTPQDPEAHYARGLALVNIERLGEAVTELQQATQLRPCHYYEWLDLGVTLDRTGDPDKALAAIRESIRLAPAFAQPHWQLGNLLYRRGEYDAAFPELRLGVQSNPNLYPALVEFAAVASNTDPPSMERLVDPQTTRARLELGRYLAIHGQAAAAAEQGKKVGTPQDNAERLLLQQIINVLMSNHDYAYAYEAWSAHHAQIAPARPPFQVLNGDFTQPIVQDDPGFGWQTPSVAAVSAAIDTSGPANGANSIRLEFSGDMPITGQPLYQLVIVQPGRRYRLSFYAKAEGVVSGGPPVVTIVDPYTDPLQRKEESRPLSTITDQWEAYQVDFSTGEKANAIRIDVLRLPCNQNPCPIFGRLWLSRFSLTSQ